MIHYKLSLGIILSKIVLEFDFTIFVNTVNHQYSEKYFPYLYLSWVQTRRGALFEYRRFTVLTGIKGCAISRLRGCVIYCAIVTSRRFRFFRMRPMCHLKMTFRQIDAASFGHSNEDIQPMRRTNQQSGKKIRNQFEIKSLPEYKTSLEFKYSRRGLM